MDIKATVQEFIPGMDSTQKVYELFRLLRYPQGKVFDPTYKTKIEEFDLAREEREKVKDIFTVFNYDGKLQVFLIELLTDRVFSEYRIENYPIGIYRWLCVTHELLRHNDKPFVVSRKVMNISTIIYIETLCY